MGLVRNFPQYYCKNIEIALEASPGVPVNGLSTRDVSVSTKSLATRAEQSSNPSSGDCMERVDTPSTQDNNPIDPEN